jgi:hypothetical protein
MRLLEEYRAEVKSMNAVPLSAIAKIDRAS